MRFALNLIAAAAFTLAMAGNAAAATQNGDPEFEADLKRTCQQFAKEDGVSVNEMANYLRNCVEELRGSSDTLQTEPPLEDANMDGQQEPKTSY
ncbi:hypothetical protein [Magnetofaba australis]|uniref:Uncharacterized protein n=1 Tax=Magnetofaba australis IT-1 TaxID=1434232 RepID=A0A1Y2KBE1_9PROT|nr:hypothetical protein [Magnetofaba australis]OSM07244.1 hypothetical protein MAIT1_03823 [Magnetofaba australis IT-1]